MDPSTTEDLSGKSGQWFLEAVGEVTEPPPPATVLEPASPVESSPTDAPEDVAALPGTADTTSELVGQMWRSTGTQDPLENWEPADLDRHVSRKRNFRWTMWIMAGLSDGWKRGEEKSFLRFISKMRSRALPFQLLAGPGSELPGTS